MKLLSGLIVLAVSLAPYVVWAQSSTSAAAVATSNGESVAVVTSSNSNDNAYTGTTAPVCGTDGRTYRNENVGACAQERCNCNDSYAPLCGEDFRSYRNQCAWNCENRRREQLGLQRLGIQYGGNCTNCDCDPNVIRPICARNGVTYRNVCSFMCMSNLRRKQNLPRILTCSCNWTSNRNPVCGSNGLTYESPCFLNCENKNRADNGEGPVGIAYYGRCE